MKGGLGQNNENSISLLIMHHDLYIINLLSPDFGNASPKILFQVE